MIVATFSLKKSVLNDCVHYSIIVFKLLRHLTEVLEVNLNVRDKWDSTPLYYASGVLSIKSVSANFTNVQETQKTDLCCSYTL